MRKLVAFLGASLVLGCAANAKAQQAPDMFKDLDRNHWAYEAVESLRSKGIVIGYPDGYFRGKRTLTRYEFAVALDRALKKITNQAGQQGEKGDTGPAGAQGEKGDQGPPGVTPEELATLRRLTQEFADELKALGNNIQAINRRLDALAKDVADIKAELARMPKFHGGAFMGFRSDNVNGGYVDRDGRVAPLGNNQAVVHLFDLGVSANIPGGATLDADLQVDNYRSYLSPNGLSNFGRNVSVGGLAGGLAPSGPSDVRLDRLEINTPLTIIGHGSELTLGRFHQQISHLTLWKPDTDTYFDVPWVDDGAFRMDGARLTTNFGSVSAMGFAAQSSSVTGTFGNGLADNDTNSPIAGATSQALFFASGPGTANKPIAQPYQGQMRVDQAIGGSLGLNFHQLQGGHIRASVMELASRVFEPTFIPGGGAVNAAAAGGFRNVTVYGVDGDVKVADRITVSGEWAQTVAHGGRLFGGSGTSRVATGTENNAFNANVGYGSHGLTLTAGYRYIDPRFYAPGYWGRIGNWVNPTNVMGPTFRAGYNVMPNLGVNVGGDFFWAARDRSFTGALGGVAPGSGGLGRNDEIDRLLVGAHWDPGKGITLSADWEGVYYTIQGAHAWTPTLAGNASVHPTEQWIRLGTGYNLTSNTVLKLMYEIGFFDGHGLLTEGGTGRTNVSNVATVQAAVKF